MLWWCILLPLVGSTTVLVVMWLALGRAGRPNLPELSSEEVLTRVLARTLDDRTIHDDVARAIHLSKEMTYWSMVGHGRHVSECRTQRDECVARLVRGVDSGHTTAPQCTRTEAGET